MTVNWRIAYRLEAKFQEIIAEQGRCGICFDTPRAQEYVQFLEKERARLYSEIRPMLEPEVVQEGSEVKKPFKKSGELTQNARAKLGEDCSQSIIGGPFCGASFVEPDLGSRWKLMEQLKRHGWSPTEYTEKGNPRLTEDSLEGLGGVGEKIALWHKLAHRQSQIEGWIENVREDGRIEAQCNPLATNTGRVAHKIVANVPKPNKYEDGSLLYYPEGKVVYGTEMRSLFTVESGRKLVGADAAGLEARILAHYMNDPDFTKELLEGDIHTKMLNACDPWVSSRDTMKNCFYAFIFGAGNFRLGVTAGYSVDKAQKAGYNISEGIKWALPALDSLNKRVQKASERGHLIGLDGRKVWMRRDKDGKLLTHKALNTLIQSAGIIAIKVATCYHDKWIKEAGIDATPALFMHDEVERDSPEEYADEVGQLIAKSIEKSGEFFNLRVPLEGEYAIGDDWASVH